jgi:hypothetical protein
MRPRLFGEAVSSGSQDGLMAYKKNKERPENAAQASVKKEMAKPRMARSARIEELKLDTDRIPENPSTTMSGTVIKIIRSRTASEPEKAQIDVDGSDYQHGNLRIENTLVDEHGDDVSLKKGAHVDLTVTAKGVKTGR